MKLLARKLATTMLFANPTTVREMRLSILRRHGRHYLRKVNQQALRMAA